MSQFKLFVLSASFLMAVSASAESIRVYESPATDSPIVEATFGANLKHRAAWINVYRTSEAPEHFYLDGDLHLRSSRDDFELMTTAERARLPLVLDAEDNIVLNHNGENIVCAHVVKKHFLFIPYTKIILSGHCVLDGVTNFDGDRQTAMVDLIIK